MDVDNIYIERERKTKREREIDRLMMMIAIITTVINSVALYFCVLSRTMQALSSLSGPTLLLAKTLAIC